MPRGILGEDAGMLQGSMSLHHSFNILRKALCLYTRTFENVSLQSVQGGRGGQQKLATHHCGSSRCILVKNCHKRNLLKMVFDVGAFCSLVSVTVRNGELALGRRRDGPSQRRN